MVPEIKAISLPMLTKMINAMKIENFPNGVHGIISHLQMMRVIWNVDTI